MENFKRGQTPFTPAVGVCVELHTALQRIERVGLSKHLAQIAEVARDFRERLQGLPVRIPAYPLSNAITPVIFEEPIAYRVFELLKDRYGIYVNPTGGALHDTLFRVAHIGQTTVEDNRMLVARIREAMTVKR